MIALLVVVIVAGSTALAVRAGRTVDDPRRRHPSAGGANRPGPARQPVHVRMIRPVEELDR